jgi:CheY-like chemotaxis protein
MPVQSLMMLDMEFDQAIRCRHISEWFKMDSYVPSIEGLLAEIERNKPDVVVMDLDLYAMMDGIETSRKIRSQFDIPVMYV